MAACDRPTSLTVSRNSMLPDAGSPLAAHAASSNPPDMHPSLTKSGQPFKVVDSRCGVWAKYTASGSQAGEGPLQVWYPTCK